MSNLPDNIQKALDPARPKHNYGTLHESLKAKIRLVTPDGQPVFESPEVVGVMTDGDFEVSSQYSSPFENSNPEQKLPTLIGMIQSGQFVASLGTVAGNLFPPDSLKRKAIDAVTKPTGIASALDAIGSQIEGLQGRSNLTKINSTQIFVSTAPVAVSCTLFFRAWKDAALEVEENIRLLEQWALPGFLYESGIIQSLSENFQIENLFPSVTPPFVSLQYGGKLFSPMILESVTSPLVVERDQNAKRLAVSVQCRFVSRQAWDANDVRRLYGVPAIK